MWIKGKGEHGHRLVNTAKVRYFLVYGDALKAIDIRGNDVTLMKFGEKSDGIAMIQKIGKLIASGCRYLDLEDPDKPYFGKDYDPQEQ